MCNEIEDEEGGAHQFIRMSKTHIIEQNDKIFFTVAEKAQTYGEITLDNKHLQVPNMIEINSTTIRCFFRATIANVNVMCFRDFNVVSETFSEASIVQAIIKQAGANIPESAPVPLTQTNAYLHYSRCHNAELGDSTKDFFITSDMVQMQDGAYWTCVSIGSGYQNKLATSILARSTDNGATWMLLACINPYLMPGVTGVDVQFFWEAALAENNDYFFMFGRGASTGLSAGLWMAKVAKTNLYTYDTNLIKVSNTSNQKPCVFKYDNQGWFILNESPNTLFGSKGKGRTSLELIKISTDFTVFSRLIELKNANGVHTPSFTEFSGCGYICYSSSELTIPQTREGVEFWGNTSDIWLKKLNMEYFKF
jgi:hypothetical protein